MSLQFLEAHGDITSYVSTLSLKAHAENLDNFLFLLRMGGCALFLPLGSFQSVMCGNKSEHVVGKCAE
jgi:hypothetical protein